MSGQLHQIGLKLIGLASRIERASTELEENTLCDERDRLLSILRRVDEKLSGPSDLGGGA